VSGDGDTRQVISSTTMDGSVSYLRFRTQGPPMTRPIPAPHAAAIGVRHAGRDPDACQESGQAGCRSSPRRPDEKRIKKITVAHEFDSAGHAAALLASACCLPSRWQC
jgi:hypothetical protein